VTKKNKFYLIIILFGTGFLILGLLLYNWQASKLPVKSIAEASEVKDMGISYVVINRTLSPYYSLEINSGALITEVFSDSPAEIAGIKVGDMILRFNGTTVSNDTPLLGLIKNCLKDNNIELEVSRNNEVQLIEMSYSTKGQ
jgi:S1-C subfamily serine protease